MSNSVSAKGHLNKRDFTWVNHFFSRLKSFGPKIKKNIFAIVCVDVKFVLLTPKTGHKLNVWQGELRIIIGLKRGIEI